MTMENWEQIYGHSNTDKIGKLKYMVKLESDIWSNSNMWSKLLPIYGQSRIYGQILYDQTQIHGQMKVMVIFPILYQTCSKYMVKFKKIPLHNSHGYDVSIS